MKCADLDAEIAKFSEKLAKLDADRAMIAEHIRRLEKLRPTKTQRIIKNSESEEATVYDEVMPANEYTGEPFTEEEHDDMIATCCKKIVTALAKKHD